MIGMGPGAGKSKMVRKMPQDANSLLIPDFFQCFEFPSWSLIRHSWLLNNDLGHCGDEMAQFPNSRKWLAPDHPRTPDPFLLKPGRSLLHLGTCLGSAKDTQGWGHRWEWTDP